MAFGSPGHACFHTNYPYAGPLQHGHPFACCLQREAQKTKWMVDLVMKVDGEYAGELAEQRALVVSHPQGRPERNDVHSVAKVPAAAGGCCTAAILPGCCSSWWWHNQQLTNGVQQAHAWCIPQMPVLQVLPEEFWP